MTVIGKWEAPIQTEPFPKRFVCIVQADLPISQLLPSPENNGVNCDLLPSPLPSVCGLTGKLGLPKSIELPSRIFPGGAAVMLRNEEKTAHE